MATEIDENLNFKGIAGTADNFYQIVNGPLDFLNVEQPKSYFY